MIGYHFDLVLNADGNPYINGIIAIANEAGWFSYEIQMATWKLYSKDGGVTWQSDALYDTIWFEGQFGNIFVYNRFSSQRAKMENGLVFSWLDT
jgi:hypothetical protein